ncbi:radical SAM protein [Streptomyces sp. NPDC094472]|uniref:radical SAM protein n=1 Tax=unclassified Streptomyces TaxID=2593676 RepID=UPI003329C1F2
MANGQIARPQCHGLGGPPSRRHPSEHATHFLWLDLTRKCQLACGHCFNSSGPDGTHGAMTREDWFTVLDQGAGCGVRRVQLIGGEPTMHPDGPAIVERALSLGLGIEVYSNLVHVSDKWWELLGRKGVSVATSYYSDRAVEHNAMTGRPSHTRTLANIKKALRLGISVRVGIVAASEDSVSRRRGGSSKHSG